jgi:phage-related minor tail protein
MAGKTLQSTIEIAGSLSPSLQQAIKQAVDRLEEMSQETLESAGAAAKLAAEINTQESVLRNLQRGYEDYIVSGSESTDEALRLADTIQDLSNELNENRGALEAAHEAAQKLAGGQQETADAYSKLQKQIGEQEAELATLRRSYANVALEQGETSAEARQLASQISQLSGDLNENRQRLSAAEQAADQLGNSLEDAGQDAESSSEGYTVLKNVLANLVTEGINKAVDAFKELATEGDTSLAMLSARTGATAQELEGFEDVMYEVYNSNYGDSLGDVSEKLSTVIQMTDNLDKASLAQITKNAIALEDVFGFDVVESLRAANSLTDQFGISAEEAFNLIVQGAQKGLNQNDDLLDTINEYSVQFRNAGYSADDMFNMLANGAETGTWSIDKLGDAVKEFNIRMSDGTANEYLEQLGLNTEEVIAQFNKGGPEAQAAIGDIMEALQECDDATLQYQAGVGLFGTMWEDLGVDTVASLMDTQGAIQSTSDAMAQLDSAAYDTLESSLSQLGRTIKSEVVQPVAEELTPAMKEAVDYVNANVAPAVDWVSSHLPEIGLALGTLSAVLVAMNWGSLVAQFGKIKGAITGFTTALGAVSGPVMAVIAIVAALAAGFMYLWQTNEDFRANVTAIWAELQASFSELGAGIMQMINQLMPLIQQTAATVLSAFAQIASAVIPVLVELIGAILPVIIDLINQMLPILTQIVQTVLTTLIDLINQLLPVIMQIIQAVLPVLVEFINALLPVLMQIVQAILPVFVQLLSLIHI